MQIIKLVGQALERIVAQLVELGFVFAVLDNQILRYLW
jgi:hypothetical protein